MMNEEDYVRERMGDRNPFTVPEGYFDQLAAQIIDRLPADATAGGQQTVSSTLGPQQLASAGGQGRRKAIIKHLRPMLYAAACVALAVFGVTVYLNRDNLSDSQQHLAQQQETVTYSDNYIDEAADYAMLDKDDIYASLMADI